MNRHAHRSCRLPDASQAGSVPDSSASQINKFVAKVISAMVNNPRFVEAIQAKIGTAVDTEDMEKQIAVLQGWLKQAFGTKSRLERQMDTLDINDVRYDRKILDLQRRYDE